MPRKPTQKRARATVQAIVDAGFIAVSQYGVAGVTTRHIAEIAGVGVGSLYEYFANKEEIFDVMLEQFGADIVAMIRTAMPSVVGMEIRPAILRLAHDLRKLLEREGGRYLNCSKEIMQLDAQKLVRSVGKTLNELAMQFVLQHPDLARVPNLPAVGYVVITGGMSVVIQHLSDPEPVVSFEDLADALARMVDHYVQGELPGIRPG